MGCGVSQFYINMQFEPKNGFSTAKNHSVYVPLNRNKSFLQQSKVRYLQQLAKITYTNSKLRNFTTKHAEQKSTNSENLGLGSTVYWIFRITEVFKLMLALGGARTSTI